MIVALLGALAWGAELTLWHPYRGAEEKAVEQACARWGADNGHVVRTLAVPFGAYDSKIETAVPRGNGPDVFIAPHASVGKWSAMGVVTPTDLPMDGHLPSTQAALAWGGHTYGLPIAFKSLLLLYDPEKVKTPPATTDELVEMARAHTGGGSYGLVYQATEPYFHAAWMHAFGAAAYSEDGTPHLDGEGHVRALALTRRLASEEGIAPKQPTAELVTRLYADGAVAFVISGPWFVADVDRPIAAAPLPIVSETGQPARPYLTVDAVFLAEHGKQPEVATALMTWLAGPEGAAIRQETGRQAVSWAATETQDPLLKALAVQAENAVPMPANPDVANVFEAQARALRRVVRGAASPEAAAIESQAYYEVFSRPPPPPTSPWPYVAVLGIALAGAGAFAAQPLRAAAERARVRRHLWDYAWIAPAALAMAALVVVPFVTGASVAFFSHHQGAWTFVGLRNFADILLSRDWPLSSPMSFFYTLGVTVMWTAANVFLHVSLGVGLAMVLREPWVRMRGMWRAALILPWAIPNYITALIWKGMFHAQYGAVNALLGLATGREGPAPVDWFGSFATAFCANLVTNTWLGFPFMMVVTLGALQSIPRELEEAAEVDGAGPWFRFRHVILPLLKPALLPAVILGSVWTFNMFNVIYLVSAGEPDGSTEILISEAYRWAFSRGNRYGYAAAYALIIFFVLFLYGRFANRLVGRKVL